MRARHVNLNGWLASLLVLFSSLAHAEVRLLNKGGAYRFDIEMRQTLTEHFSVRLSAFDTEGFYQKQGKYSRMQGFVNHNGSLLLLDWHPFGGSFRGSMGVMLKHQQWRFMVEPYIEQAPRTFTLEIDKNQLNNLGYEIHGGTITVDQDDIQVVNSLADRLGRPVNIDASEYPRSFQYDGIRIESDVSGLADSYTVEIPEISLNAEDARVSANVQFQRVSPYFGIGWGTPPQSQQRLYYSFDMGVISNGTPELAVVIGGKITGVHERVTAILEDWRLEQEWMLSQKAERYRFFPYVSFGLSVSF